MLPQRFDVCLAPAFPVSADTSLSGYVCHSEAMDGDPSHLEFPFWALHTHLLVLSALFVGQSTSLSLCVAPTHAGRVRVAPVGSLDGGEQCQAGEVEGALSYFREGGFCLGSWLSVRS